MRQIPHIGYLYAPLRNKFFIDLLLQSEMVVLVNVFFLFKARSSGQGLCRCVHYFDLATLLQQLGVAS